MYYLIIQLTGINQNMPLMVSNKAIVGITVEPFETSRSNLRESITVSRTVHNVKTIGEVITDDY